MKVRREWLNDNLPVLLGTLTTGCLPGGVIFCPLALLYLLLYFDNDVGCVPSPLTPRWDVLWGRHKGTASHSVRASFPPRAGLRGCPRLPNIRFHPRAEGSVWLTGLAACHKILYCTYSLTSTLSSPGPALSKEWTHVSCCLALPFHIHICFCKHFVFAYMCYQGDPLDLCLISSPGTRQCDSLGFITHENSGMSL